VGDAGKTRQTNDGWGNIEAEVLLKKKWQVSRNRKEGP
jgi:hypothetical protein